MLDTFMVLWTRGLCSRFLQTLATFLCLFIGICVMLFLITASGVKWPGLAVTVTPPGTAPSPATSRVLAGSTATPRTLSAVVPQNPPVHSSKEHPVLPAAQHYTGGSFMPIPARTEKRNVPSTPTAPQTGQIFMVPPFLPTFLSWLTNRTP